MISHAESHVLSKDEENKALLARVQAGDNKAMEELCKKNYGFVRMKALKHFKAYGSDLSAEDLIQEGYIGFMKAAIRTDLNRDNTFLTYAGFYVENYVMRANADQGYPIRIPINVMTEIARLIRAEELFRHLHGQEKITALADCLRISESRVKDLCEWSEYLHLLRAGDFCDLNDEDPKTKEIFTCSANEGFYEIDEEVERKNIREILLRRIERLTEREQYVLLARYSFTSEEPASLEDIGKHFNVTRERVRQIEAKALRKLRYMEYKEPNLVVFLDHHR